jgi:sterol desaturase/sphingolipid hydroxylase (fatty acid hydroxylase superfamily)
MNPFHAAIPVFFGLMLVEAIVLWRSHGRRVHGTDAAASLTMGIGHLVVDAPMKAVFAVCLAFMYQHRLVDLGDTTLLVGAVGFVVYDFLYYWWHRSHHEIRFFWAAHEPHHSSEHYNLSTALRQSWTTAFTVLPVACLMPLMGFEPVLVGAVIAANTLYQFWIHTETVGKLGPLEWVMNTPSHHRVHHGRNVQYMDRNHAGVFIVWDRLFGTFEPEEEEVCFGLATPLETYNPVRIAFNGYIGLARDLARVTTLHEAWMRTFGPPGWSPDGSTKTVKQLRAAWEDLSQAEPVELRPPEPVVWLAAMHEERALKRLRV